jgi:hypothetical protein
MARPQKQTIDYFPHYVSHGKTMLILQNEFNNDGYAFWYQLLELLCKSENQYYDYNNPASWRLLLAETHIKEDVAINILATLADVDAIDKGLYAHKIIWVQNLVDNLDLVYNRRSTGKPQKPVNENNYLINDNKNRVNVNKSTQTILNNTKQYNTNILMVFNHWNKLNIIVHKELNGHEPTISKILKTHSPEEINQAITTYSEVLNGEQYFFKYKWTLKEFLIRGLEKFINPDIAKSNYLKDKNGGNTNVRVDRGNTQERPSGFTDKTERIKRSVEES